MGLAKRGGVLNTGGPVDVDRKPERTATPLDKACLKRLRDGVSSSSPGRGKKNAESGLHQIP